MLPKTRDATTVWADGVGPMKQYMRSRALQGMGLLSGLDNCAWDIPRRAGTRRLITAHRLRCHSHCLGLDNHTHNHSRCAGPHFGENMLAKHGALANASAYE